MPITDINHYLVRTGNLERSRRFYVDVLGFDETPRPDFPFPGYWLGVGGGVQVHLAPDDIPNRELYFLGTPPGAAGDNSGAIDHVAFVASDPRAMLERLRARGVPVRSRFLSASKLYQLFVTDPDGITIELNFNGVADVSGWDDGEDYAKMARVPGT
ncbi:MAG: VOC family protein [Lautropia sp.]